MYLTICFKTRARAWWRSICSTNMSLRAKRDCTPQRVCECIPTTTACLRSCLLSSSTCACSRGAGLDVSQYKSVYPDNAPCVRLVEARRGQFVGIMPLLVQVFAHSLQMALGQIITQDNNSLEPVSSFPGEGEDHCRLRLTEVCKPQAEP